MADDLGAWFAGLLGGFAANKIEELAKAIYEPAACAWAGERRPVREQRQAQAHAARDAAWADYSEVAKRMSALKARLAEAEAFDPGAELDPEESSVAEFRDAAAQHMANTRIKDELHQRIALVQPMLDEAIKANGAARAEAESADAAMTELDAASADPFSTALGKASPAYERYLTCTGEWRLHLQAGERGTPTGKASRRIVMEALRASGLLGEIEAEAIARHQRSTELADRVSAVNAAPGNPHWQGSLERPGDRTPLGPVSPASPG